MIEQLGISTELAYDEEGLAVNFEYVNDEYRNADRPLYSLEEKKATDIIVALLQSSEKKILAEKSDMTKLYQDSYSGIKSQPILSLMMWGPQSRIVETSSSRDCCLESDSWNQLVLDGKMHNCRYFSEKHYWMFGHSGGDICHDGDVASLEGPAMTDRLVVVYPCSNTRCMVDCVCDLCNNTSKNLCSLIKHKSHIRRFHGDCLVQKESQCQLHWVAHPDLFETEEDVFVEKNLYFHNNQLLEQPRTQAVEVVKFAGIKKACVECKHNVYDHFQNHLVFHLQCKFCSFQLATLEDQEYWEKVCKICGKMFDSVTPKKINWHAKCHEENEHFQCEHCDASFKRKFTLDRHMQYDHEEAFNSDPIQEQSINQTLVGSEVANEEHTVVGYKCTSCGKVFRLKRYLVQHFDMNHTLRDAFKCSGCGDEFRYKKDLTRHEANKHFIVKPGHHRFLEQSEVRHCCKNCTKEFKRMDHLRRHEQIHSSYKPKYDCSICGKKLTRKEFLKVHTGSVHMKKIVNHSCSVCGRQFNIKSNLQRHRKLLKHL